MSEPTKEAIEEARAFHRRATDGVILNAPEGSTLESLSNEVYRRMALELATMRTRATNDALELAAVLLDNANTAMFDMYAGEIREMKVPT